MILDTNIISPDSTLLQALDKLNALSGGLMTLMVVDAAGILQGTLTDGDIRRGLLAGHKLHDTVSNTMCRNFRKLTGPDINVEELQKIRSGGIRLVPIVDNGGRVIDVIDMRRTSTRLPLQAILMAGGKGVRLQPLTLERPKPLLNVGGEPIINYNIRLLARAGVNDVTVTVNYLAEQIEEHFKTPVEGIHVKTLREPCALGTAGAAALVPVNPTCTDTLLMNSDLLTTLSLEDMYLHHRREKNHITVAAIPYNVSVPYAVLQTARDGRVTSLEEKPSMSYYANAGIYLISNRLLRELPTSTRTDATDLIDSAIAHGHKVTYFPINGTWIDIGSPADYAHACELMKYVKPYK